MSSNVTTSTRSARVSRQAKVALRKIATFEKRFGTSHLPLLYQAAFPLALTPDLLYRLWANFQRDINGRFFNVPWVAVADILLSSLCEDVGQELYEIDSAVRNELLKRLQADDNLGQQRIQELSDFLLDYVRNQLQSSDVDTRDFAQAQKWTVLAYTKPGKAVRELATTFQQLGIEEGGSSSTQSDKSELIRMAAVVETLTDPLVDAELQPLLAYARGISSWAKGDDQQAREQLEQVASAGKIQIAGVDLPIPEDIHNLSDAFDTFGGSGGADYQGQKLRGHSFRGQDLRGANFSYADIRGADFSKATLTNANFSYAKTGLQRRWASVFVLFSLLLILLAGILATVAGGMAWWGLTSVFQTLPLDTEQLIFTWAGATGLVGFVAICAATLLRTQTPAWNAGALGLISSGLFATAFYVPIVLLLDWIGYGSFSTVVAWALIAIAVILAIALYRVTAAQWFSTVMAGFVSATLTVLSGVTMLAFVGIGTFIYINSNTDVVIAIALSAIATVVMLFLVWRSGRINRLSGAVTLVGIVMLIAAVITGSIVRLNQLDWITVNLSSLVVGAVAIIVMIPFVVRGTDSDSGAVVGALIVPVAIALFFLLFWFSYSRELWASAIAVAGVSLVTAVVAWAIIITIAIAVNLLWKDVENRAIAMLWTLLGTFPLIIVAVLLVPFAIPFLRALSLEYNQFLISTAASIILASSIPLLGIYIGWRALIGDPKYASIQVFATAFAAKGGTSFRGATLTDADFTEATLKSADFTDADLTRTCWFHVQKIDHACVGNSYLQHPRIQQLLTTGIGNNQTFNGLNLEGISLRNMNLADASFVGTNLSNADLSNVNLSRARLVNTQLDGASLSRACLTGAYTPGWVISDRTNLQAIDCQYIFTKLPTKDAPDPGRYPADHRKILKPGELANMLTASRAKPRTKVGKTAAGKKPSAKAVKGKPKRP